MKIFLLSLAILLSSCATVNPPPTIDSSKRIDISGVSVLPPQEGDWSVLHVSTYQIALGKRGGAPGESEVINVSLYKVPQFDSNEAFLSTVKKARANEPQTGRFKIISNSESLTSFKESTCVIYKSSSEDHAAKTEKGLSENMLLENTGYNCLHPKNKSVGVNIEYSIRRYPNSTYGNLENKINAFFNNIEFIEF